MALMDKHLRPMAKLLGVPRYGGKDENWRIIEIANRLVAQQWVPMAGNRCDLFRENSSVLRFYTN